MKKTYYLYIALSVAVAVTLYACVKDYFDEPSSKGKYSNGDLTVQEAREFFEGFVTEFKVAGFSKVEEQATRSGKSMPAIAPVWSKGKSFTFEGVPTVEIPLNIPPVSVQIKKDGQEVTNFKNTIYYLLAGKTGEGEILYYVATYTADVKWFKGNNLNSLRKLSLSDMSNFSGAIRFYDLSGNLLGGKFLKDGVRTGIIKASANSVFNYGGSNNMTRSGDGWDGTCAFPYYEYSYVCSDGSFFGGNGFDELDDGDSGDCQEEVLTSEYVCNGYGDNGASDGDCNIDYTHKNCPANGGRDFTFIISLSHVGPIYCPKCFQYLDTW